MNTARRTLLASVLALTPLLAPVGASAAPTPKIAAPLSCYSTDRAAALACVARQPVVARSYAERAAIVGPGGTRRPLGAQYMSTFRGRVLFFPAKCFRRDTPVVRECYYPARSITR